MSTICQIIESLQNLTNAKISQSDIARVFGVTRASINTRVKNKSQVSFEEIKKLEKFYNVTLINRSLADMLMSDSGISFMGNKQINDVVEIPYWEGLPNELKHPEYSYVVAQKTSIEQAWQLEADNLRIVPMVGDKMTNYWYKINDRDILIVDTSKNHISGNGVYFAVSQNNTRFWIREMQVLVNNDVEFKGFAPSGNTVRIVSKEDLEKVGFKIIGKVIKNVSFRL